MGIFHRHQKEYASRRSSSDADGDPKPVVKESRLHIRFDPSERSLWEKAWNQTKAELGWYPPEEWHIGSSDISTEVANVHREASRRAKETRNEERHVGESKYTYRQVYDNVVNWATKFQNVGDIVVQADPGYAALPWVIISISIV